MSAELNSTTGMCYNSDYRTLLRERLEAKMQEHRFRFHSHRALSDELGISPALLSLVLAGKRHLNVHSQAFAKLLSMLDIADEEREYITLQAQHGQARNLEDKIIRRRRLAHFKSTIQHRELSFGYKELLKDWRCLVLFELISLAHDGITAADLSGKLNIDLEPDILQAILSLLRCSNLIYLQDDRYFARVCSINIEELDEITATAYHEQMAELAARSVSKCSSEQRRFGSVTVAVREEDLAECLSEIDKIRHRLRELLCQFNVQGANMLLQVNLQSFLLNNNSAKD